MSIPLNITLTPEQREANARKFAERHPQFTPLDAACNDFWTQSDNGREVVKFARRFSSERHNVLITGESGTGKELVAKILHGNRDPVSFRAVNCAGIPDTLFESELFGYEPGTFTGGLREGKRGMIEAAKDGTLFLDEMGELPMSQQVKLLRVLQENEFYRVGGNNPIKANCRFVFATNRDLGKAVADGTFRADLFFRIYILHVHIPPLRERPDDVILIAQKICADLGMDLSELTPLLSSLRYDQGNVRQLRGEIIRAFYS